MDSAKIYHIYTKNIVLKAQPTFSNLHSPELLSLAMVSHLLNIFLKLNSVLDAMLANKAILMVFNTEELIDVDNLYVEYKRCLNYIDFLFNVFIFGE